MKKFIITIAAIVLYTVQSLACTNLIVTKGASSNGSNMCTYSADSHQLYGTLYFTPAADYPAGTMVDIYEWDTGKFLGQIPQVEHVYSVIGNMNEHQLVIAETTYGGREFIDSTAIMDYGSLIYLALQRCKTAREAINLIDNLMQTYGYASEGESFTLCDPEEIWIMELIGKNPKYDSNGSNLNRGAVWVAKRIPDGYISGHANQARITTIDFDDPENCLYSADVITHAREEGLFSGRDEDFSFCDVYNPLDFGAARGCEARVWAFFNRFADGMDDYLDYALGNDLTNHMPLYVKPNRKLGTKDLADMMRDHFEGTPMDMTTDIGAGGSHLPYRWRPMEFEYQGWNYVNERAIATQQTGWWFVAQSRPGHKYGIYWFGVDDAATSPLMPFASCMTTVPECLDEENGSLIEYSETAMFWIVNRIAQFAYLRYDKIGAEVRQIIDDYESGMIAQMDEACRRAAAMESQEGQSYLTQFCLDNASALFKRWQELDKYLLVKYIDGNIKRQNPDGSFMDNGHDRTIPAYPIQEEYSDKWKEHVVRENGDLLRIRR